MFKFFGSLFESLLSRVHKQPKLSVGSQVAFRVPYEGSFVNFKGRIVKVWDKSQNFEGTSIYEVRIHFLGDISSFSSSPLTFFVNPGNIIRWF